MKKRILVLAGGAYVSGAEKVTLDVCIGLKEGGYEVFCLLNGWNDGDMPQRLLANEIPYKEIKLGWIYLSRPTWTLDSLWHMPRAYIQMYKFFRKNHFDCIYSGNTRLLYLLFPFIDIPVIQHVHDKNSNNKISNWLIKKIDKRINIFIAISDFIKKDLIKCGIQNGKIVVVHNGVDKSPIYEKLKKDENIITFGIIGQIIPKKGHEDAVEACSVLLRRGIANFRLKIVGKGDESFLLKLKKRIEELGVTNYVVWSGFLFKQSDIYDGIDVVVVPTRDEEPFALTPLEAFSMKTPVITANNGGFPECVEEGVNGFMVPPCDPVALSNAMSIFISNPETISRMGELAFRTFENKFTKRRVILEIQKSIEGLYE